MTPVVLTVQDSQGTRRLPLPLRLAGANADVALPGPVSGTARLEFSGGQWWLRLPDTTARLNGRPRESDAQLSGGDVIELGGAQLVLHIDAAGARLGVFPLHGNETIAPLEVAAMPGEEIDAGTREIRVADTAVEAQIGDDTPPRVARNLGFVALAALAALIVGALFWIVPVPIEVQPAEASVSADVLHWHTGDTLFLPGGQRQIQVTNPGYHPQKLALAVDRALAARGPLHVELAPLPGILQVDTQGIEAEVFVDGASAGAAPGAVEAPAGRHAVLVRAPRRIDHLVELDIEGRGREQSLLAVLAPAWGTLEVDSRPAGARVFIDGNEVGTAPQQIELDSGLHKLELRAAGRRSWRSEVAIVAGETLALGAVDLAQPPPPVVQADAPAGAAGETAADAPPAPPAPAPPAARVQSPLLGTLILVPAGTFQQGSDRREQGRRSNETLRTVTLSAPFYLAEREVTNAQFRTFRAAHASGIAAERTLDLDEFAVSGVTWDDAVAFCNWLSQREGLPLAYERRDGRWQLVEPFTHGYRLPTEAEWEYAARYAGAGRFRRYSWGDGLPPPAAAENLAGSEINAALPPGRRQPVLPGYTDEYVVVAPVGRHGRSGWGFADIGGNVSEWVHDVYASLLPAEAVTDPRGEPGAGPHVIRGANWRSSGIAGLRLAWRDRATGAQETLGFRVARGVEVSP